MYGERIGLLCSSGGLTEAMLYAAAVAYGRMLAIAIVAKSEARVAPIAD